MDSDPLCLIVIGMAGSGKSTFMQVLSSLFHMTKNLCISIPKQLFNQIMGNKLVEKPSFMINLDPGVLYLPYTPQIDIRKTINYKELMTSHGLGPNGAIMTSLNLYAARFHEVLDEVEKMKKEISFCCVDTPGQIEVFTWSASGSIITNALAYSLPTVMVYVVDSVRCQNPNTFMSNMLFCCSIFYKLKLPMVVVFNKNDVEDSEKLVTWLKDYDQYLDAVHKEESYLSVLSRSLCLSLDEFYKDLNYVSVSSLTGAGFENLFKAFEKGKEEYKTCIYSSFSSNIYFFNVYRIFLPDMMQKKEKQKQKIDEMKLSEELKKFEGDLKNLDLNKTKEENQITKHFFEGSNTQKIQIDFPIKAPAQNKKNEVIIEEENEEEKQ